MAIDVKLIDQLLADYKNQKTSLARTGF